MTMQKMKKVLILGGSTYDLKIYLDELPAPLPQTIHKAPHREGPGSTGTGKAVPLTLLGVPSVLYTAAGDDWYGRQIEQYLQHNKVAYHMHYDPAGTQRHVNLMDRNGGRISMFITQSSENLPHDTGLLEELLTACDIVVLNIIPYCKSLIPLVKASGKEVWTDLHDYDGNSAYHSPFINCAQFVQLSSDNLPNYQPVMEKMMEQGKEMVVCTHGKKGASLMAKDGSFLEYPAIPVESIVDSNGAGDSFFAGMMYGYLHAKPWHTCLHYGLQCGALAVQDEGLCYRGLTPAIINDQ